MVGAFLANETHTHLRPLAGYHVPKHLLQDFLTFAIPLKGHPALEEAWERRRPVASSNVATDPRVDREVLARFPHRSNLFCPMIVQGDPIGGLFVAWFEQEHRFTPAELRLVDGISRQAGIALANARLVQELQQRQARLEALLAIGSQLSRIQPVDSLLVRIAEACGRLFDASSVSFRLVEGDELVPRCHSGRADELLKSTRLRIGQGLAGSIAATGQPLVVRHPFSDPRITQAAAEIYRRLGVRAFLGVPVKTDDRVVGVLTARTHREGGFSVADIDMARAFASQAAIALENSRLYQEAQHAFDELSKTQTQLVQSQKMEAIGQLAGGVAHDFNNILTVISGRSRLLLARLPGEAPDRRHVELIDRAANRAAALTRQLLAFSRKQVLQPKAVHLDALVAGLAPMLTRLIGEHIELVMPPATIVGQVAADPGQLEQVIMNLGVNARDAMPEGGTVRIETRDCDLDTAATHGQGRIPPGSYVTLGVQDAGCGMDSTTLGRIFEPFFTTKEPGKGTGLGLSTVYGIIQQSGGYIGVDSAVGRGTTFTIYLPRTATEAETAEAPATPAPSPRGGETILLVDDDAEVRAVASEVLTGCGYTVWQAGDPREALRIVDRHPGGIRNGAPPGPVRGMIGGRGHGSLPSLVDPAERRAVTPLTVYLPFNLDCLHGRFTPAKRAGAPPPARGHWLLVQEQALVVAPDGDGFALPTGAPPVGLGDVVGRPLWLGTWAGTPCWVAGLPPEAPLPGPLRRETLVPMQGTRLPDDLLTLGGMAMQLLHWESSSAHCPRCGARAERMAGEWGKRCPACRYEHYPHLHPAVIVLVRDGERVLLARKAVWAPGRYALVAGFLDNGESLEGAVAREVREEVGVEVKDIRYVGSQNWPFPSQVMIGFVAEYAGGEIAVDHEELEDARWFPRTALPVGPARHSIAGWILEHFARARP